MPALVRRLFRTSGFRDLLNAMKLDADATKGFAKGVSLIDVSET